MNNEDLRKKVKLLKVFQNVAYKELAEYLQISSNSFYNWLKGYYNLSRQKQLQLSMIIDNIRE